MTFLRLPSAPVPSAVLVASSLMLLASLPFTPVLALLSALLRVSLAFTSTGMNPCSLRTTARPGHVLDQLFGHACY